MSEKRTNLGQHFYAELDEDSGCLELGIREGDELDKLFMNREEWQALRRYLELANLERNPQLGTTNLEPAETANLEPAGQLGTTNLEPAESRNETPAVSQSETPVQSQNETFRRELAVAVATGLTPDRDGCLDGAATRAARWTRLVIDRIIGELERG